LELAGLFACKITPKSVICQKANQISLTDSNKKIVHLQNVKVGIIIMNKWTKVSIEYANQKSYLDDLFAAYPTIPDRMREINEEI
jgi:hypothetical protein